MSDIFPYEIRWARPQEWKSVMSMVWDTFMKFEGEDYSAEGIRNFYDFITDEKLYQSFLKGRYQMMVALDDGEVVGMASVRNGNHLSLLFVKDTHHRRGIGRRLLDCFCDYLKTEMGQKSMTVQAAPYALDFYKRTGFFATGPEQQFSGIRVTSMERRFMSKGSCETAEKRRSRLCEWRVNGNLRVGNTQVKGFIGNENI